jgi:hypothetical protein
MARPTDYKEEYCELIVEFFDQPLYIVKKKEIASGGRKVVIEEEVPNSMPTFERFARKLGVEHDTLRNWCKKHEKFFGAYKICKDIQKDFLIEHGSKGNYNAAFTKFLAVNVTDLRDKVTHEVTDARIEINIDKKDSEL